MTADDVIDDLAAVLIDPEDNGFYKSRTFQWATLCPHMSPTDHRVFTLLVDLCSAKANIRRLTLAEIAAMLPAGKAIAIGQAPHSVSVSTIARSINALSEIGQITDRDGAQLRVSNKTRTDLVLAPWRSLRHDCTASRNVYDALARVRGAQGDDGPRHPVGLGAAPNLVPDPEPAPDLVPAAPDLVPSAPDLVPPDPEAPDLTSENREESISPFSLPEDSTHTPGPDKTDSTPEVKTEPSVCVDPEQKKKIIEAVRLNVVDRAPASRQKNASTDTKKAIIALAIDCFDAKATVEEIDVALSQSIDAKTKFPYTHGTEALKALLARKQGKEDPLGTPQESKPAEANSWVNPADGQKWPEHRPDERPCKGQSCGDFKGKRYVAVEERLRDNDHYGSVGALVPVGDAFSCQTCKNAYEKEGLLH